MKKILGLTLIFIFWSGVGVIFAEQLTSFEQLGKNLFFDMDLSAKKNLSCASCHSPEWGWTGPDSEINEHGAVYEGSIKGRFGNRKPPSAAYATQSPILGREQGIGNFVGGNFWDGRATGEKLGNPAADQAQGPFLNPVEQALDDPEAVIKKICKSSYSNLFQQEFNNYYTGETDICSGKIDDIAIEFGYDLVGLAIAAYEASSEVNQFSSKYDAYLAGTVELTPQEKHGLQLFNGKGKCAKCHISKPGPKGEPPLFTDFTYDNLGVPRNPENPWYEQDQFNPDGYNWLDKGLGGFLWTKLDYSQYAPENLGKQKVPTLRNVDKRPSPVSIKAYSHNGFFKSLEEIVIFYNTRDVGDWPPPEITQNINTTELGDLKLTDSEENAIVAFLKTLSDGFDSNN